MTGYLERSVPDCCRKSLIECIDVVINYSRASRYRLREPHSNGDCARSVHESYVFITLGLALSKKQIPKLLKTLETKIVDGAIGEDSGSLQAGGHRFDPGHVHQLNSALPIIYAAFSAALFWCNFKMIPRSNHIP